MHKLIFKTLLVLCIVATLIVGIVGGFLSNSSALANGVISSPISAPTSGAVSQPISSPLSVPIVAEDRFHFVETPNNQSESRVQFAVAGEGYTHYSFQINNVFYGRPMPIDEPLKIKEMAPGRYQVGFWGLNANGEWDVEPIVYEWDVAE